MKQDVANSAVRHTLRMEELHSDEIQYSVNNTTVFEQLQNNKQLLLKTQITQVYN